MKTLMRNGRDRRSENPSLGHAKKERVSLFGTDQLGNAIVGTPEPPTELAVDILHHHHICVDVGLVVCVEVSGRELVQHGWAVRDDGG